MIIEHTCIGGERPLFGSESLQLRDVTVLAGESALKCSRNIEADACRIEGMYVFWECDGVVCTGSVFAESARACSWYGHDHIYRRCLIEGPKMFRELSGVTVEDCRISSGSETFWRCTDGRLDNVELLDAGYCFLGASDFRMTGLRQKGKYAFQYSRGLEIRNSVLDTKDAFWESEGCTVYDSEIKGEYLGWYSRGLKLVRCRISGTQPLCYCEGLVLEDCSFDPSCDRCFEKSSVRGTVAGSLPDIAGPVPDVVAVPYNSSD